MADNPQLDLGAVLKLLAQEHELEPDLKDPKLSSLAAIQTALLCEIAKSLRVLTADSARRLDHDRVLRIDVAALGIDPRILERAMHDAVRRAHDETHHMRMSPDYGQRRGTHNEAIREYAAARRVPMGERDYP